MQIYINDDLLDFTLEEEKVLGQVTNALMRWLNDEGFVFVRADIETATGEAKTFDEASLSEGDAIPLETLATVRVTAKIPDEILLEHLDTITSVFRILKEAIQQKNSEVLADIMSEYENAKAGIDRVSGQVFIHPDDISASKLDELIAASKILMEDRDEERTRHLVLYLTHANYILGDRIREIIDPAAEFRATLRNSAAILPKIEQVPVQLQTGKDREAMNTVLRFIETSQKLLRIYPRLKTAGIVDTEYVTVGERRFEEFYSDYNAILHELIEAFTQEDSVLIGDLLEYELLPRTGELLDVLDVLDGLQPEEET
jgi:hypothetical protein